MMLWGLMTWYELENFRIAPRMGTNGRVGTQKLYYDQSRLQPRISNGITVYYDSGKTLEMLLPVYSF